MAGGGSGAFLCRICLHYPAQLAPDGADSGEEEGRHAKVEEQEIAGQLVPSTAIYGRHANI